MQTNGLSRTLSAEFLCLGRFKLLCVVLNTVVEDLEAVVLDLQHGQIWSCKVHKLPQQKRDFPAKFTNYHSKKRGFPCKVHKLPQLKGDFPAKSTNYHIKKSAFPGKGVLHYEIN